MAKKTNSCSQSCGGCLVLIVLGGVGLYFAGGFIDRGFDALEEQRQEREVAKEKLDEEKPIGTEARLRHEIADALGTSNRNVDKVSRLDISSGSITVTVAFDDNLTQNFIRGGIQRDIADILKAAKDSGYDFSEIHIDGSFPLVDKFGASTDETVVRVQYSRATVDRINWSRFLPEDIYDIADSSWLHPAVRGESR